jgi:hypothetical protein
MNGPAGYIAYYNGQKKELTANDMYQAKLKAIEHFKVPRSKQGLLAVVLAEVDGKPVLQTGAGL